MAEGCWSVLSCRNQREIRADCRWNRGKHKAKMRRGGGGDLVFVAHLDDNRKHIKLWKFESSACVDEEKCDEAFDAIVLDADAFTSNKLRRVHLRM